VVLILLVEAEELVVILVQADRLVLDLRYHQVLDQEVAAEAVTLILQHILAVNLVD
jgi:hypothetical protein